MTETLINLYDLSDAELSALMAELNQPAFRAKQLAEWLYKHKVATFEAMTNLPKPLRETLAARARIGGFVQVAEQHSAESATTKRLYRLPDAQLIESVLMEYEDGRRTACISTQAGCAMGCVFCATGQMGFARHLSAGEIVEQAIHFARLLEGEGERLSNVVLMGMGEPLLNFDNVVTALSIMLDDHAYGLSRRRVTVSTSGIVPAMDRLRQRMPVALAVSLHAPDDALRDELVPINRKYPLSELMAACRRYVEDAPRDFITFEYVMLDGVNDQPEHARALIALTREVPCKFNLIPFNPFPDSGFRCSPPERVRAFANILQGAGLITTTRKTRGADIDAACGQLAGRVQDRTRRVLRRMELAGAGSPA